MKKKKNKKKIKRKGFGRERGDKTPSVDRVISPRGVREGGVANSTPSGG